MHSKKKWVMATMLLLLLLLLHNHPILLAQLELTHSVMATFQQQKEEEEEEWGWVNVFSLFYFAFYYVIVLQYYSPHFIACGLYKVTINSLHGIHKPSTPFRTKEGAMWYIYTIYLFHPPPSPHPPTPIDWFCGSIAWIHPSLESDPLKFVRFFLFFFFFLFYGS